MSERQTNLQHRDDRAVTVVHSILVGQLVRVEDELAELRQRHGRLKRLVEQLEDPAIVDALREMGD